MSDVQRIVAEAIETAGAAASQSQIFRTVNELCRARGLARPSRSLVRIWCSKLTAGSSIADRMGLNAGFAVDRAILDLTIRNGRYSEYGQLVCLVDLRRGTILRHLLSIGDPSSDQIASLVDDAEVRDGHVAVSESDPSLFAEPVLSAIRTAGAIVVPGRWRAGTAVRAAIGLKLGRVALLSQAPSADEAVKAVEFQTANDVIDELLLRRGCRDRGASHRPV